MKNSNHQSFFRSILLFVSATMAFGLNTGFAASAGSFAWTNLDSDIPGAALWTTPELVDPVGIVPGPAGNIWVCDNGTGLLTRYDDESGTPLNSGSGTQAPFPAIPILSSTANLAISGTNALSAPTGIVLNHRAIIATGTGHGSFLNPNTGTEAWFLMASEDGAVSAYSPVASGNGKFQFTGTAAIVIDNSLNLSGTLGGAVYKGLALAVSGTQALATTGTEVGTAPQLLYVANFRSGNIEVYDKHYQPVNSFTDPTLSGTGSPALPEGAVGWAPFNIKRLAFEVKTPAPHVVRLLFVAFAAQNANKDAAVPGAGAGFIDVFDTAGNFLDRIVDAGGDLNAPWGMAFARGALGEVEAAGGQLVPVKAALIVGNKGDGLIHAYNLVSLASYIQLSQPLPEIGVFKSLEGQKLRFGGLWGLHFGRHGIKAEALAVDEDDLTEGDSKLFFSAGPVSENAGIMGNIYP